MDTDNPNRDNQIDDDLDDEDGKRPIYLMATECNELFDECLVSCSVSPYMPQVLRAYQCRFDGWCTFLGVFADESAALDYRLREHVALQDMINRMLDMLRQNLFLGKGNFHSIS
jgi:hypothetical protein